MANYCARVVSLTIRSNAFLESCAPRSCPITDQGNLETRKTVTMSNTAELTGCINYSIDLDRDTVYFLTVEIEVPLVGIGGPETVHLISIALN